MRQEVRGACSGSWINPYAAQTGRSGDTRACPQYGGCGGQAFRSAPATASTSLRAQAAVLAGCCPGSARQQGRIDRARGAEIRIGEQNYKAGHLEAARKDFDEAVDWMLESGYDLNGDARLSELFHRVGDAVYADELQAFRAGDGFQEAPAVLRPSMKSRR